MLKEYNWRIWVPEARRPNVEKIQNIAIFSCSEMRLTLESVIISESTEG
jgi:hypothetical protein